MSARSIVRTLLGTEIRGLLRDRRALFAAVVLPALLYPLLFLGMEKLEDVSRETMESREVVLALDTTGVSKAEARELREELEKRGPLRIVDVDASDVLAARAEGSLADQSDPKVQRERVEQLLDTSGHLLLAGEGDPQHSHRTRWHLWFDVKDEVAREGRARALDALETVEQARARERRRELLGEDPAFGLDLVMVDVASEEAARGAALGKLLPILAVIVLISGGSYAALSVFAGEREAGTLETLLVQPVSTRAIASSKFLAVLLAGVATLVVNVASLVLCVSMGWGRLPSMEEAGAGLVGLERLAGTLAYLPACVLLAALLCRALVGARTFREGQLTVLPVTLACMVPSAIVLQPELKTDVLLAILPLAGPALLMRDALRGSIAVGLLVPMTLSHLLYSALILRSLARSLDGEALLSSAFVKGETQGRREFGRHALRWSFISVLAIYVIGGALQEWRLLPGLVLTFWALCPLLSLFALRHLRRRTGAGLGELLGLRAPSLAHLVGCVLCLPALIRLALEYESWQRRVLPLPAGSGGFEALAQTIASLPTPWLLFLFALSPGVCEELLFRGALLAGMRRDFRARESILWQALAFAAAHASLWRLVPTAFMGAVLTAITLRSRSLWPAILMHVAYDGLLVAAATERLPAGTSLEGAAMNWLPWLALPGLGLLLFGAPRRPREAG